MAEELGHAENAVVLGRSWGLKRSKDEVRDFLGKFVISRQVQCGAGFSSPEAVIIRQGRLESESGSVGSAAINSLQSDRTHSGNGVLDAP